MKKQSNLSRLLEIAGSHKYLTYASWVLSAISALIALVPFYYIWKMIKEVLEVAPDFGQAQNLTAGELDNGYKIRRAAIDLNVPLITNARLASAFINAFCTMTVDDIAIKSWEEYK